MTPPGPSISGRRHRWFQLIPVPATPYAEILGIGAGRRTLAISLALLITGGLLLLLLTFGLGKPADNRDERITVVSLERSEERRVGKECVRTCRSRWSQYP